MRFRVFVLACVMAAMLMGATALALGISAAETAANNNASLHTAVTGIETLLLNGKTASAISAKKTAKEVKTLLSLQAFDHQQTQRGTKTLGKVVREVEQHLDATIRAAIAGEAAQFKQSLGQ